MSEKCHIHLVTLIKHHGLFVPYIVYIFAFENLDLALHTCQPIQAGVDENHLVYSFANGNNETYKYLPS